MRVPSLAVVATLGLLLLGPVGCRFGYEDIGHDSGASLGGEGPSGGGGSTSSGGNRPSGGAGGMATGGAATGGSVGSGGTGGGEATGGSSTGGASTGGSSTGGSVGSGGTGGEATGGSSTGGTSTGGSSTGGSAGSGGTGGAATGGSLGSGGSGGAPAVADLLVTTASDEANGGATPSSPGGNGFSLREAISFANAQGGSASVTFEQDGLTIQLGSPLPIISTSLSIQGPATLDGSGAGSANACVRVDASNVLVDDIDIQDCQGGPVLFDGAANTGNQLSNGYLHDNGAPVIVYSADTTVFFNFIIVSGTPGVELFGTSAQVLANQIVGSGASNIVLHTDADDAFLLANLSIGGSRSVSVGDVAGVTLWHNTLVSSTGPALDLGTATDADVRNNIFYGSSGYAIVATSAQFAALDHNLYSNNGSGRCSNCTIGGSAVTANPNFVDPSTWDYSLQNGSPAIDGGEDLGDDRNLEQPGLYNGAGPDIGYIEMDY